jgi:diacylglycerol kinase family enzyme
MKFFLIMNPGSRSGKGKKLWPSLEAGLRGAGADFRCAHTTGPGDAFNLAYAAADCDVVVAVGGDGTINGALDGLIQSRRAGVKLGVVYTGTSPDFCRFNNLPTETEAAVSTLLAGRSSPRDAVRIIYSDYSGNVRTAHFACSCNIGMGAAVARRANRARRYLGDVCGTGLAVLRTVAAKKPVELELELDGVTLTLPAVDNLTVAKNPYIASGLKLELDLLPADGQLWAVGVCGRSRAGLLGLLPDFYSGKIVSAPGIFCRGCRKIKVRAETPVEIEFDGDPRGLLPAAIELLPKAYQLISND